MSAFWKDALERAGKTFAQTLVTVWGVGDGMLNLFNVNLLESGELALSAAVLSLLTSVISKPVGDGGTASLTNAVEVNPAA
jgi:hypothetical protein